MKDLIFVLIMSLAACGGGYNPDQEAKDRLADSYTLDGKKFFVLSSEETLAFGEGTLSGKGVVRFADDLVSAHTAYNYVIEFYLDQSGEIKFFSHANSNLKNGVEILFRRSGDDLEVLVTASGFTDDWSTYFSSIDPSKTMSIGIDVHNDEAITHLLFWNDLVSKETLLLDSAEDVNGSPGNGFGQNWGLGLHNAVVSRVERGNPRNEH